MKTYRLLVACVAMLMAFTPALAKYQPSDEVKASQKQFRADRFGIFIHWGIYSTFAQGEWYLNAGISEAEYRKAAKAFYPSGFDADEWASAIHDSGARYITFTSRHHDGFSMWNTEEDSYNIVDGTPYGRDVLKELADACGRHDLSLHLYYSHLDWHRNDYPTGRTGLRNGRTNLKPDYDSYFNFMNRQLTELLTGYGPIRAIWFDGYWDHDEDTVPFDWRLQEQYAMIHRLQPSCMVANNHHEDVKEGEDIQIFERDVPGENTAGYSSQQISQIPLETCQTMNGMWGYKVSDTNYKSTDELIRLLVKCSGMGANLLLNVGPQPDGRLPQTALERLKEMGVWMRANGETIYDTTASDFEAQAWGTSTRKGNRLFVHILNHKGGDLLVPTPLRVRSAHVYGTNEKVRFTCNKGTSTVLHLGKLPATPDYIVELITDLPK